MNFKIFLLVVLFLASCRKYPIDEPEVTSSKDLTEAGLFVLNEGLFQHNNASLQFFPDGGTTFDFFESKVGRPLGDTGNDMKRYGDKLYVVVNVSSTLEVLDIKTGKSVKQIEMNSSAGPKQPRFLAFKDNKCFVSCFDGYVDVIDTANFEIQQRIKVGANPEQMVISNNRLYVTNSGGLNFPNVDSTMSIIDLDTYSENKVVVGLNPGAIRSDQLGNIYMIARGDYNGIPSRLLRYNEQNQSLTLIKENVSGIEVFEGKILLVYQVDSSAHLGLLDLGAGASFQPDFISLSDYTTFYRVQYSKEDQRIYTFDARSYVNTGLIRRYSMNGVLEKTFEAQIIPTALYYYVP